MPLFRSLKVVISAGTVLAAVLVLSSCGKANSPPASDSASPAAATPAPTAASPQEAADSPAAAPASQAKYSWIRAQILDPKCMSCHSTTQGDGDGLDSANFDTYEGVLKKIAAGHPEKSKLFIAVKSGKMPKGMDAMPGMPAKPGVPLSQTELNAISAWIASGAPNN